MLVSLGHELAEFCEGKGGGGRMGGEGEKNFECLSGVTSLYV